jgi:AraC family transcriptional regulator, transcriptional activator of pobA
MLKKKPIRVKSISEFHRLRGLPPPQHPLVSVMDFSAVKLSPQESSLHLHLVLDFYVVFLKRDVNCKLQYGQQQYDFNKGVMFFIGANQLFSVEACPNATAIPEGWMLLIHPDFLWNTPLAKTIQHYEYFGYSVNEALFLSAKEEATILHTVRSIEQEYLSNIDKFSQNIIISQIETILNYAERFYQRQFITRKKTNHQILRSLEDLLNVYFSNDETTRSGLPTVQFISDKLNISPNYLSSLLKILTGQSAQQHIHEKLIEKAKEKLSTTNLSVSEIAYELGFKHPQSFTKLFKNKTKQSPVVFRTSFN